MAPIVCVYWEQKRKKPGLMYEQFEHKICLLYDWIHTSNFPPTSTTFKSVKKIGHVAQSI